MFSDGDGPLHTPLTEPKKETWRVIRPLNEVRRVRTKRSLLSLIPVVQMRGSPEGGGVGFPWLRCYIFVVFALSALIEVFEVSKQPLLSEVILLVLLAGIMVPGRVSFMGGNRFEVLIGFLAVVHAIHPKLVWATVLMIPLPMVTLSLLSKDLVLEILVELDFYVMQILQAVTLMHAMEDTWHDMPWGRLRCSFWFLCLPSFLVAPLVDAYPAKYRPHFLQLYFSGMSAILVCWHAIHLYRTSFRLLPYKVGDLLTLTLFYFRQVYVASWHPDNFVLIKCTMYTEHDVIHLSGSGSGVEAGDVKKTKVAPPRSYSFRATSHPISDWTDSEGVDCAKNSPDEDERNGAFPAADDAGRSVLSRVGSGSSALESVKEEVEPQGSSESDTEKPLPTGP